MTVLELQEQLKQLQFQQNSDLSQTPIRVRLERNSDGRNLYTVVGVRYIAYSSFGGPPFVEATVLIP